MSDNHVIAGLHAKLDEIGRTVHALEAQLAQLQSDRATLSAALAILDPAGTVKLAGPPPLDPLGVAHGHFSRSVLDVMRRAREPLTPREIGAQLLRDRGLNEPDKKTMNHVVSRVRNALARMRGRLTQIERGQHVLWSVPGRS